MSENRGVNRDIMNGLTQQIQRLANEKSQTSRNHGKKGDAAQKINSLENMGPPTGRPTSHLSFRKQEDSMRDLDRAPSPSQRLVSTPLRVDEYASSANSPGTKSREKYQMSQLPIQEQEVQAIYRDNQISTISISNVD